MSVVKEIKEAIREYNPGAVQLQIFGLFLAVIFAAVYILYTENFLILVVAAVFALVAAIRPFLLLPVSKFLIAAAYPVGWILSRLLLTAFFYLILTPIGIIQRIARFFYSEDGALSYWREVEKNDSHDRMGL